VSEPSPATRAYVLRSPALMNGASLPAERPGYDSRHPRWTRKPGACGPQNPSGPCRTADSAGSAGSDRGPLRSRGPQGLCGRGQVGRSQAVRPAWQGKRCSAWCLCNARRVMPCQAGSEAHEEEDQSRQRGEHHERRPAPEPHPADRVHDKDVRLQPLVGDRDRPAAHGKDPGEDQERRCLSPEQPGNSFHQERRRDEQGGVDDAFNESDGLRTIACPRGDERPRRDNEQPSCGEYETESRYWGCRTGRIGSPRVNSQVGVTCHSSRVARSSFPRQGMEGVSSVWGGPEAGLASS